MAEERTKVDAIIKGINDLTDAEKRELTIAIRTTTEGNKAYVSFLYGIGSTAPVVVPTPEPTPAPCDNPTGSPTDNPTDDGGDNTGTEIGTETGSDTANTEWL